MSSEDEDDVYMEVGSSPKAAPAPKKAPARKKAQPVSRADTDSESDGDSSFTTAKKARSTGSTSSVSGTKTVEEIYQKKTQLEHILLRPDTYIGSVEKITQPMWVFDDAQQCMVQRTISFVPGLFKIFDEILVNAADNKIRDPGMDTIRVDIDVAKNCISILNNGRGIPIEMHSKEKVWVPELIFGHLLTSSNYDDDQKKVTGGRNGYGAKLCNIFSTEFIVETVDSAQGKKFKQVFTDNMSKRTQPSITACTQADYTRITFSPDMRKFGMPEGMDADIEALFRKRVYDVAGCVKDVKVFLNGERIKVKNFKQYVELYVPKKPAANPESGDTGAELVPSTTTIIHEVATERWEIACMLSDGQFQQVSFVNSICTYKGGTHVSYIADQIVTELAETLSKKNKAAPVKPFQIKNHLFVFVNCLVENPTFDSQTKENMTLRASAFGSKCKVSEEFMKKVVKSGIVENILSWAKFKQDQLLKKTDGHKRSRITGIAKLDDANNAGTKKADQCTLILTEGDSAKALAVSGLSVVGRDNYGVFPLRGKLLNVREATHKQITENQEINNVKQILGLQHGKVYTSTETLRYGHLMIMTDQDHDGSHIKGLLINFIDHFWPSLLKVPGFLIEFITPIVKCTRGREELAFYTIPEYESWKAANEEGRGWNIKYFKGLGTSTAADAKKYFSNLGTHVKRFSTAEQDRSLIELAFSKKKADDRKEWLRQFVPGTFVDHRATQIPLSDFINKELILFSMADNVRSIPSVVDGFKPGHRKIMFACFKRKLRAEIKLAQLAGYVSEHAAYHHGEQSLCSTIVGLAQNFVGSNNVNLLEPIGQFGTRLQGGKDAASPRYIFTSLSPFARAIYRAEDDALLEYLNDDGQSIEPKWYVPALPMVLVNGVEGIGTGWSTSIPNYNPVDIVSNLQRMLRGDDPVDMHPWYSGFTGVIEQSGADKYKVSGTYRVIDDVTVEVTELPVGVWTQVYKEYLEELLAGTEKQPALIREYKEYHTDTTVHFVIIFAPETLRSLLSDGSFEGKFKLTSTLNTTNLVCFDPELRIKKYAGPLEILREFYVIRRDFYSRRKAWLEAELAKDLLRCDQRVRFIREIVSGQLRVQNRKKADIVAEMLRSGYQPDTGATSVAANTENEEDQEDSTATVSKGFDYLLGMPIHSLTAEKIARLQTERDGKAAELVTLQGTTAIELWMRDLEEFLALWNEHLSKETGRNARRAVPKTTATIPKKRAAPAKKKAAADSDEDSDEDQEEEVFEPVKKTPVHRKPAAPKKAPSDLALTVLKAEPVKKPATPAAASKPAVVKPAGQKSLNFAQAASAPTKPVEPVVDIMDLPLSERIAYMLNNKKGTPAPAPTPTTTTTAKKAVVDDDDEPIVVAPKAAAAKRMAAPKKRVIESDSDEEDNEDDIYQISD